MQKFGSERMKHIDEQMAKDIKDAQTIFRLHLDQIENRYGNSFKLKAPIQSSWIDGEKLINHFRTVMCLKDENEGCQIASEKYQ